MVDQTKDRIQEVQTANHARTYKKETINKFNKWLKECPVKYEDVTSNESEEVYVKTIDFQTIERK
jgi:hypothetical protein|tara:strand:- start:10 stop:204 length:195 start_codon:yes stop_codon:yes gene_type:complete